MQHRILHLSTVHPLDDGRIFRKEVRSLRRAGLDVTVTGVPLGPLPDDIEPARSFDQTSSRYFRSFQSFSRAVRICRELRPDIFHFHDPEILPALPFVRRYCRAIVYDSHEFLSEAIQHKEYVPAQLRPLLGSVAGGVERLLCRYVDAVVAPTPHIAEYFRSLGKKVVEVANYPTRAGLPSFSGAAGRLPHGVYTGGLSEYRGLPQMIEAARITGIGLDLAGPADAIVEGFFARGMPDNVCYHGNLSHAGAVALQSQGMVGMSLLMPTMQYVNAIPTKIFEFFAAGLIVVCSNFPFLRKLFAGFETIKFVDPANVPEICAAFQQSISEYTTSQAKLLRSRERVLSNFTWESEADKLVRFYSELRASLSD